MHVMHYLLAAALLAAVAARGEPLPAPSRGEASAAVAPARAPRDPAAR